jgi:predicted alpha/beta superfamily hydrolase
MLESLLWSPVWLRPAASASALLVTSCAFVLSSSELAAWPLQIPPAGVETFTLDSKIFGNKRAIRVFLPAGYRNDPASVYPALFLNDGFAAFTSSAWNAPSIVARLIAGKKIPEIVLIGIDSGATASPGSDDERTNEYLPHPDADEPTVPHPKGNRYPDFLIDEVLPAVAHRYRIRSDAAGLAIGGASYGALAALYTVIKRPGVFGRVLLESPSLYAGGSAILADASSVRAWPARMYVGAGTKETGNPSYDRMVAPALERLRALIRRRSPQSSVTISIGKDDKHDYAAWSRRLPGALTVLWPGSP